MTLYPGDTIGILGGGQLARMLCLDARRMGYRTIVWSGDDKAEPTEGVADEVINLPFDSAEALERFCSQAGAATVEFENIPSAALRAVEAKIPLRPGAEIVEISQNRAKEKSFLSDHEIPCAPFALVETLEELQAAYEEIGPDAVLKTAESGYDGKGQVRLREGSRLSEAWDAIDGQAAVLEGFVDFVQEASVLIARGIDGEMAVYPVSENEHRHHILDFSIVPARVSVETESTVSVIAQKLAEELGYVGLLAVEFFILADGSVVVNELAPRPHNSGHYTMDANTTAQFEQQLRAVCGLPLGGVDPLSPVVMLNLLGDMWHGDPADLDTKTIVGTEGVKLHLYGKSSPSGRRKLGHVNVLAESIEEALETAQGLKSSLLG